MKKITKKLCSAVCALLTFSGNRGGTLTKEALYTTKEILCNAGQWLACLDGVGEVFKYFYRKEEGKWILEEKLTCGQKFFGCAIGIATIANAVDASKRSYDIAHDVIKGSNNKPDTTNKKESTNYWPILEAIFGVSQFAYAFGHKSIPSFNKCKGVCRAMVIFSICGLASLTDAYFRFCRSNQIEQSPKNPKEKPSVVNKNNSQPQKSQDPEMKQKS